MKMLSKYYLIVLLILTNLSGYAQIKQQEKSMWCWAACIQSVLAQANIEQTQSEIVCHLTKTPKNRPAHIQEVVQLLQSYQFRAWAVNYPASAEQLFSTLNNGWKLIALVNPTNNSDNGHFIILQAAAPQSGKILVSDPATGQTYWQSPNQLYNSWKWYYSVVVGTPVLLANR